MAEYVIIKQKLLRGGVVGLVGAGIALLVWTLNLLEFWEAKTWDLRVAQLAKPGKATDEIRLILVDQSSLNWGEEIMGLPWPWPREVWGIIVEFCRKSEVKTLTFDGVFTEASGYGVEDDAAFGTALAAFPNFVGTVYLGEEASEAEEKWPDTASSSLDIKIAGLEQWLSAVNPQSILVSRAVLSIPEILQHSKILCNIQQNPDPDGVYRRIKPFVIFDNKVFPTLGLGLYLAAHSEVPQRLTSGKLMVGEKNIPLDTEGNAILRYRGQTGTHKAYSAASILRYESKILAGETLSAEDRAMFEDFMGKYVLFGYSAPGLYDLRPAPVGGAYPGVEIHATMLDNLLSGDFIRKTPPWVTITLVIILALACAIMASFLSHPIANLVIGVVFLSIPVGLVLGAYVQGFWLPLVVQELTAAITIVLMLVVNYATEGRQKRFIKNAFKHYLSPAVIDQLLQHPEQLKLGGEKKTISIFFSDLQGFTSISEALSPEELTAVLNEYLSAMSNIIQEEHGTIDKYEGDAIIAFWNAPLNVDAHAVRAVRAALRCQAKLAEMRPAFKQRINKDMFMRIGLNTGAAVVGNMGSRTRFDYTMFGDAVNLAARLEGVNKQFGTYTMLSQFTRDQIDEAFAVRELARVAVVGKKEPVTVYEPMLPEEYEAQKDLFTRFAEALELFYRGSFTHAREVFRSIEDRDPAAAAYAKKCREYLMTPPEHWDGVWMMTTK